MLGLRHAMLIDQRGAEAAAAEIAGEDDIHRGHLESNIASFRTSRAATPIRNPSSGFALYDGFRVKPGMTAFHH
ncbi:hypothetical protein OCUBac02_04490 [Bosea sp. ANAM02]|nr:hypothetical protein OCUBac02_04490 [Bosea sp. ANAM02]